jgi:hypothetical protein
MIPIRLFWRFFRIVGLLFLVSLSLIGLTLLQEGSQTQSSTLGQSLEVPFRFALSSLTESEPEPVKKFEKNDRISSITFKRISDWHFGGELVPNEDATSLRTLRANITHEVKNQSVIFVGSNSIRDFYSQLRPRLNVSFVLVTGDTDSSVPNGVMPKDLSQKILQDPQVLHWYAMNTDMPLEQQRRESKFTPLVLGINQWGDHRKDMQRVYELGVGLKYGLYQNLSQEKDQEKWILSSFTISNNVWERKPAYDIGCNATTSPLAKIVNCFFKPGISGVDFYKMMARHKFILSPHGMGLDCYRTYESLMLGSYPIVKTSTLDYLYKDLPVVIVPRWDNISLELLERKYKEFRLPENARKYNFKKLYVAHWNQTFRSHFL